MKIRFVSNYFNHHQKPLCDAFIKCGVDFRFYYTCDIPEERLRLGYQHMIEDYVCPFNNSEIVLNDILSSSAVIFAVKPGNLLAQCLNLNVPCFIYSERLYKKNRWRRFSPIHIFKYRKLYMNNKTLPYILCAGGYVSGDYRSFGFPRKNCFKWGYFPNVSKVKPQLDTNTELNILWVGRFIDWKHPEAVLKVSEKISERKIEHHINMIGDGILYSHILQSLNQSNLSDNVSLLGSMPPHAVYDYMNEADILLVTSDGQEGWGAVLNEGMAKGCVLVVNKRIGAAPYLISSGINGYVYSDISEAVDTIEELYHNRLKLHEIASEGIKTIENEWNAHSAAINFLKFINNGEIPESGPMSLA